MKIIIAFDDHLKVDKMKVLQFLNSKCKFLKFSQSEHKLEFNEVVLSKPYSFNEASTQLHKPIGNYERAFCFTDTPYDDNYFFHEHNLLSIYSFYGWAHLTNLPKSNGIIYFIVDYFALQLDDTGFRHQEETGCIYDFLLSKTGIDDGMRQSKICPTCLERVNSQISSEKQINILEDLKILMNDLSSASKWNKDIFENLPATKQTTISKRPTKKDGEINVVIASPGDTAQLRQHLLDRLEIQFRKNNHEAHCKKRLIVHGWEDLASQNGYAQDVINEKIISNMDIVISLFKHKLGTPTINQTTGIERALSGTAEELLQALDYSTNTHPLGMAYFHSKAPVISVESPDKKKIEEDWLKLKEFKKSIRNKLIYKPFAEEKELLQMILHDLEKNIIDYYE